MSNVLDEVKAKLDFVGLVGQYTELRRKGKGLVGLSPFSDEKTPSFYVNPEDKVWYCWSTKKGGGILEFLMEKEGYSKQEALLYLADMLGIEVTEEETPESRYRKCLKLMQSYFRYHANDPEAVKYLTDRGVDLAIIDKYELGYADNNKFGLPEYLLKHGFTEQEILKWELAWKGYNQGRRLESKFFRRIMFPVYDHNGTLVGFTGRDIYYGVKDKTQQSKYLHTKFKKNEYLYNIKHARQLIREQDRVLVCEGTFDAIAAQEAGIPAVAVLGSGLSKVQVETLSRLTRHVYIVFDSDATGKQAMIKAFEDISSLEADILAYCVILYDKDIFDFVHHHSKEEFMQLISDAKSDTHVYVYSLYADFVRESTTQTAARRKLLEKVKPIANRLGGSYRGLELIENISQCLELERSQVQKWLLDSPETFKHSYYIYDRIKKVEFPAPVYERRIMTICLDDPDCVYTLKARNVSSLQFDSIIVSKVLDILFSLEDKSELNDKLKAGLTDEEYNLVLSTWMNYQNEEVELNPMIDILLSKRGIKNLKSGISSILGRSLPRKEKQEVIEKLKL